MENKYDFENLVIEGGGVRGICAGGTLSVLEDKGVLKNIKRYAGTSVGSILVTGLCIGFDGNEIAKLMLDTDFNNFLDDSWGITKDLFRLYNEYGFYKGDVLYDYIKNIISKKTGNPEITFKELYEINGKDLVIVSTNVSKDSIYLMSHYKTPNMSVAKAVRASIAIPYFFTPVIHNGDILVDGGISMNYPIHVFDGDYPNEMDSIGSKPNKKTIGLKFLGNSEKRNSVIYTKPPEISNLLSFGSAVISHMMNRMERLIIEPGYWERTISVPTGELNSLNFEVGMKEKINHQEIAKKIALEQIEYFDKNLEFPKE